MSICCCHRVERPSMQYDYVDVTLDVGVEAMVSTRAGESDMINDLVIKNLWVIQFSGTDDNAVLIGDPIYIEDFPTFYNNENERTVRLVASDDPCYIVFIANTFENKEQFGISQGTTLSNLKNRFRKIPQEAFMSVDSDGVSHIILSDLCFSQSLTGSSTVTAQLKRNMAKVSVTIKNESNAEINIDTVRICSVPSISYYLTNYDSFSSPFPSLESASIGDNEQMVWVWDDNIGEMSITEYLPVNMRGTSSSVSEYSKNQYAPRGATYVRVDATYSDKKIPITYTFYLGGNMVNDYNLNPNGSYTYNFNISGRGDSDYDSRIDDMGFVDFTSPKYDLANSYILNPIPAGGTSRTFRIPIQKLFTFWGDGRVAQYEDNSQLSLRNADGRWKAWVVNGDFEVTSDNFVISKASGGYEDPYFEVNVAAGIEGNVVVAVGPDDNSGKISWSWHLWITGYDPYESLDWGDAEDGKYIFKVKNGAVHRYEGTYWAENKSHYMMDRNLGWLGDPFTYPNTGEDKNRGLLYYQYGRKDPILTHKTFSLKSVTHSDIGGPENSVLYSIQNPTVFITTSNNAPWTANNKYSPSGQNMYIIWNDPLTDQGEVRMDMKSIFDPCPPGYRVAAKGSWSDFRYHDHKESWEIKRTTNAYPDKFFTEGTELQSSMYYDGFRPYDEIVGLQYWPFQGSGVMIPEFENTIYIPASGNIDSDGAFRHHGSLQKEVRTGNNANEKWSFLWAETASSTDVSQASGYTSQHDHLKPNNTTFKTRGCPVRCVTDK